MNVRSDRCLVVGLGGIGGIVAAHLIEQGHDVVPVSTNATVRRHLVERGFRVFEDGSERTVHSPVLESPPTDGRPFDFVFLATQPIDVEAAAKDAIASLGKDGAFVCLQNGLCEDRLAALASEDRVLGAVVAWGASTQAPGEFVRTSKGGFTIGRMSGRPDSRLDRLAALLSPIGPVRATSNLAGARWSKLAINCAISSIGTVGGQRLGSLIAHRFVRRLALEVMSEVVKVAKAEGVRLEKVAGTIDLEDLALTEGERRSNGSLGLAKKHAVLLAVGAKYRRLRSSMLAAIERGRTPSVDFLNGEITMRADRHGIPVPANRRLQETVHRIARRELLPSVELVGELHDRVLELTQGGGLRRGSRTDSRTAGPSAQ